MHSLNPTQLLFSLTQTVTTDRPHSRVCIPDRTTAEYEVHQLRAEYGAKLVRIAIRKAGKGKTSTYTVRYFTRETEHVPLF